MLTKRGRAGGGEIDSADVDIDNGTAPAQHNSIHLALTDPAQLRFLEVRLRELSGVDVTRESDSPRAGELGGGDWLAVVAGSSGLVAAIKVLPEFLRARRSDLKVTCVVKGEKVTVEVTNLEDVMPVLEKMLRD